MKSFIIIAFTLFISFSSRATYYRNYQMTDGLSSNSVWDIIQDSEGFLWFGTQNGLDRYDGKNFKTYRHRADDSLSIGNNFIHSILEDSEKRMLIGTSKGLYLYNRIQDNFTRIPLQSSGTDGVKINDIMEDSVGNIWIATHGSGLYILNPELVVTRHYVENDQQGSLPMNFIWTVVCDSKANIWLGTAGKGLVHFDIHTEKFSTIDKVPNLDISKQTIYSLYCDINNKLWIGTSGMGLFSYNYITGEASRYISHAKDVKSIIKYSDDELVMGSDQGLVVFNNHTEAHQVITVDKKSSDLVDNSIFTIIKDHEGSFWIGTYFGGVSFFSPSVKKFVYQNNLSENADKRHIVSSMVEDSLGNIMIATHNTNKIYWLDQQSNKLVEAVELEYNNVLNMLIHQGKLYAAMYGRGVEVISLDDHRVTDRLDIKVIEGKSMMKTSNGSVLFALESGGCIKLMPDGRKEYIRELEDISIADFAEASDGTLWIATHTYGAFRKPPGGVWESFRNSTEENLPMISNNLNCIFSDSRNRIWIGTKETGLVLYDPEANIISDVFDTSNGLASNKIFSIIEDADHNIWVCTEGGIVWISDDLNNLRTIGVIENAAIYNKSVLKSSANRLYFGGANGYISIDPQNIVVNDTRPNVAITGFRIFNKEVLPGDENSLLGKKSINTIDEITLAHNQSTFSFDLITLSYMVPDYNQYSYMLEGFDTEWNTSNDDKAMYMNIPPGEYIFKVRGANNDGIWGSSEKIINIRVKPHFLLSPLILVLYFLIIVSLSVWLVLKYHRHIEFKNKEVLYRRKVIQEKEMYESKIEFFTNIAHEIRTPLSLITGPLESIMVSDDGNDKTKYNLRTIERNANRLLELINQLLDFRKIENDMFLIKLQKHNLNKIIEQVIAQYNNFQTHEKLTITFTSEEQYECIVDAEAVYKIVSNLVSNAIKFATERVCINISSNDEDIFIEVIDDGPGIEKSHQSKIFEPFYQVEVNGDTIKSGSGLGLPLAQSLANKLGGTISVQNNDDKGSCFTFKLPVNLLEKSTQILDNQDDEIIKEPTISDSLDSGTKVLIVEDNKELRTFLKESLSENYMVHEAGSGKEALDMIEKASFEIIVSDIMMPGMSGLELCDILKTNPAYSHLPIILLSAKTDTLTKVDGLKKGANVYMEKPFSVEQLKAQINSLIDNRNKLREVFLKTPLQFYKTTGENDTNTEFIKKLNDVIIDRMSDEKFSIENLSEIFAISRSNFHKKIKNITGMTPNDYIKLIRLNKSAQLLSTGKYRINEVCYLVGFKTPSYFAKCFAEQFGELPKDFLQEKVDMQGK